MLRKIRVTPLGAGSQCCEKIRVTPLGGGDTIGGRVTPLGSLDTVGLKTRVTPLGSLTPLGRHRWGLGGGPVRGGLLSYTRKRIVEAQGQGLILLDDLPKPGRSLSWLMDFVRA